MKKSSIEKLLRDDKSSFDLTRKLAKHKEDLNQWNRRFQGWRS